jgi:hypothetical protein
VLSPWLVAPWLAGAWVGRSEGGLVGGAAAGLVLLAATVVTYLALAGADATTLLLGLALLVVVAGPGYGAAGAALHHGEGGRLIAAVLLGATFVVEGVLLQAAAESAVEGGLLVAETVAGVLLATWIGGLRACLIVVGVGVVVLGIEQVRLANIEPGLP